MNGGYRDRQVEMIVVTAARNGNDTHAITSPKKRLDELDLTIRF
jgi:hypothetical protein